jgi:hypothetical protein
LAIRLRKASAAALSGFGKTSRRDKQGQLMSGMIRLRVGNSQLLVES